MDPFAFTLLLFLLAFIAPATGSTATSASPETTKQCKDHWPVVELLVSLLAVFLVVIFVMLAGYLLLLCKWINNRNLRTSNCRNVESATRENRITISTREESTNQTLN